MQYCLDSFRLFGAWPWDGMNMISAKRIVAIACTTGLALGSAVIVARCTTAEFGIQTGPRVEGGNSETDAGHGDSPGLKKYVDIERSRGDGRIIPGNGVELLVDGEETYGAMLAAIADARHHIHLETYIIENDETGNRIADALIERQRAGVDVRVLYDSYGSTGSDGFWRRLRDAGVRTHAYNPPKPTENLAFSEYGTRDHRKILVVDGRVGFTGGINFYDAYATRTGEGDDSGLRAALPWFGSDTSTPAWRDTHVRIEGPAVAELQKIFAKRWEQEEEPLDDSLFFPELQPAGSEWVRVTIGAGGNDKLSETYFAYLDIFEQAQKRIWITQAYFVPDERFLETLAKAARRGVDVKVIVPGVTDVTSIVYASRHLYGDLLEAGVQIFEFQDAVLHAKTAVADGAWSIVGTSNLDYLSFLRNHEVDAVVVGGIFATQMEQIFQDDLERTRQITLAEWRRRPLGYKILGYINYWFEPWL